MAEKIELDDESALEEAVEKLWVDFFDMAENASELPDCAIWIAETHPTSLTVRTGYSDARDESLQTLSRHFYELSGLAGESADAEQCYENAPRLMQVVKSTVDKVLDKPALFHAFRRLFRDAELGVYITHDECAVTDDKELFVWSCVNDTIGLFAEEDAANREKLRKRQLRRKAARDKANKAAAAEREATKKKATKQKS